VGEDSTGHPSRQRVSVDEAARALGLTVDAVRKRVQRGTIEYEKDQAGRVRIILDSPDNASTLQDESPDTTGQADDALIAAKDETIEELRGRVRRLEREVDTRNEEIRRRDHLLAAALERIPAIEAPQEASEDAETVEDAPEGTEPGSAVAEAQDELGAERTRREMAESTLQEGMAEQRRRRVEAERERDELRRQLYARRESRESPEAADEQQGRGEPHSDVPGSQESARRPWWRRVFRG
jgi:chromosome segregation ATPase